MTHDKSIHKLVTPGFTRDLRTLPDGGILIEQRAGESPPIWIKLTPGEVLAIVAAVMG